MTNHMKKKSNKRLQVHGKAIGIYKNLEAILLILFMPVGVDC